MPPFIQTWIAAFAFWAVTFTLLPAQEPGWMQYLVKDGLPCNNVYEIAFDQKGVMWMGTEYGLVAYDGSEFRTFDENDGLPGSDVLHLVIDDADRVWLKIHQARMGFFHQGRYRYLQEENHPLEDRPIWPFVGNQGDLCFITHQDEAYYELGEKGVEYVPGRKVHWKNKAGDDCELFPSEFRVNDRLVETIPPEETLFEFFEDHLYAVTESGVWKYEQEGRKLLMAFEREGFLCQEILILEDKILLGFIDGLVVLELDEKGGYQSRHLFRQFNIQAIEQDHEGSIWLGTHQNGLIQIPNLHLLRYDLVQSSQYYELEYDGEGKLYAAGAKNHILVIEGQETKRIDFDLRGRGKAMDMVVWNGEVVTAFDHLVVQNSRHPKESLYHSAIKAIEQQEDSIFLSDRLRGLFKAPKSAVLEGPAQVMKGGNVLPQMDKRYVQLGDWVRDLYFDRDEAVLWAAGKDGLFSYKNGQVLSTDSSRTARQIHQIAETPDGLLLFATPSNGLWLQSAEGLKHWDLDLGESPPQLEMVLSEKRGETWLATRRGIFRVDGPPGSSAVRLSHVGRGNGFPFQVVNDLCLVDSFVWAATDEGLYRFSRKLLDGSPTAPLLIVDEVLAGEEAQANRAEIPYGMPLKVSFRGLSYLDQNRLQYRYRLLEMDERWRVTGDQQLYFSNLDPGEYTLLLRAVKPSGSESETQYIRWTVKTPFWSEVWFKVLGFLLAIFFLIGLVFLTTLIRRYYERRRRHIDELERKALRAQMNPHFLFNALNSIHVYIGNKEERKAHLFLSKFAKLTRIVLASSEESYISLTTELEAARYYLQLERMRHEESFDFKIETDLPNSTEKIAVPSLLIQPFIENAVLHGLRHLKDRPGLLTLRLADTGQLSITIEDNGIGRAASYLINQTKHKRHQSKGSRITIERIKLIKGASYSIQDLKNAANEPTGTRCQIYLPWRFMS